MANAAGHSFGAPPMSSTRRGAFTLLELLVAMALTLLLVYGMAEFYSYVGDTVRDGRAIVEMGSNIRNAVRQLRDDLNSVTVQPRPPVDPSRSAGYLEYVEGFQSDMDADGNGATEASLAGGTMMGDMDDILSMTIRSSGRPFVGRRYNTTTSQYETVESQLAEVVWFTTFKDVNNNGSWQPDEPRFLVRRELLIVPNLVSLGTPALGQSENFYHHNDVSARPTAAGWVANSLSDLTQRENRFIHLNLQQPNRNGLRPAESTMTYPNPNAAAYMPNPVWLMVNVGGRPNGQISGNQMSVDQYTLQRTQDPNTGLVTDHTGEDLLLPNMLAFDVRVYDPTARLYADDTTVANALAALQPGDPGYALAYNMNANNPVGFGAYVDLYYNNPLANLGLPANFSVFSDPPRANSNSYFPDGLNANFIANYDTWTTYYERDGNDQYANGSVDWAFDGLDNDNQNGVDDPGEFETSPPYLAPLRGIQVRIRMYEPGTRQTRQATVVADFVSE